MTEHAAVIGIGATAQGEHLGLTGDDLAVAAVQLAVEDAGLDLHQVDGLITCKSNAGQGVDTVIGDMLGLNPSYSATLDYGTCNFSLHLAVMAIVSGMATTVICCYGTNQRTQRRDFGAPSAGTDFTAPYGLVHIAGPAALALRRHQHLYGTTEEQFAHIALSARSWARLNPGAIFRDELTLSQYLDMPYLVSPLRRPDLTMISDGGAAVIVTSGERASDRRQPPAFVLGMAQSTGLAGGARPSSYSRHFMTSAAQAIFEKSGLTRSDIDVLFIQDPTAVWVLQMLEHYGFCPPGEAGPFLAEGHTYPGGALPVNTNGGQLSEAYMWGWLHVCEAVRQLRGSCGERQVPGARFAMLCSTMTFAKAAATIFGCDRD